MTSLLESKTYYTAAIPPIAYSTGLAISGCEWAMPHALCTQAQPPPACPVLQPQWGARACSALALLPGRGTGMLSWVLHSGREAGLGFTSHPSCSTSPPSPIFVYPPEIRTDLHGPFWLYHCYNMPASMAANVLAREIRSCNVGPLDN